MLSGHRLPRPSAVVFTRPVAGGILSTPPTGHGRRIAPCTCTASTKPPDDGSAQQDVRARIAAAQQYRERAAQESTSCGAAASTQGTTADVVRFSADAAASAGEGQSGPADAGESSRLDEAVTRYGDAWADKVQDQFTAAREQLSSGGQSGREPAPSTSALSATETEPSLTDLVIERLNKRKLAADYAAAAADSAAAAEPDTTGALPSGSVSAGTAGESRFGRGSATQAAGFLAGLAARPLPASDQPDERPGPICNRREVVLCRDCMKPSVPRLCSPRS